MESIVLNHGINEAEEFSRVTECRVCKSRDCYEVLDLGHHPLADTFLSKEQLSEPEVRYPLRTQACPNCGLMQTEFVVSARTRYQKNPYSYESSSSLTAISHFSGLAQRVSSFLNVRKHSLVVDIGSNVGTLLQAFKDLGYDTMGIDPSPNICQKANASGIETLNAFFDCDSAHTIVARKGKATITAGTNILNHVHNISGFMEAADIMLDEKGVIVIEVPYLLDLVENLAYDTIYHEHLSYFTVKSLKLFFSNNGYEIFHAERTEYLGGSIRLFIGRRHECQPDNSVNELISLENCTKLHEKNTFKKFANRVYRARDELVWLLHDLKRQGKRIVAIGAPTKGNTLLNFCRIGTNILDFASDRIRHKIGRYTPGSHIPIVNDETICKYKPDYGLLLSWNLADEIMKKLSTELKFSGEYIIPIPVPRIVSWGDK